MIFFIWTEGGSDLPPVHQLYVDSGGEHRQSGGDGRGPEDGGPASGGVPQIHSQGNADDG